MFAHAHLALPTVGLVDLQVDHLNMLCRFIVHTSHYDLDFVAFGIIIVVFALIAYGTHQTTIVNSRTAC